MIEGLHAVDGTRSAQPSNDDRVFAVRQQAAQMFAFPWPDRVILTSGATYALNQAVAAIEADARVLTTDLEHNSLLRCLHHAAPRRGFQLDLLPFDNAGFLDLGALETALQAQAVDWLALGTASNLLGTLQPYAEACALAHRHGARVILDASQGAGQVPIDLGAVGASYAAMPAHKGLHGPRGIGLLFVGPDEDPTPLVQGGTGTQGEQMQMPTQLPTGLEAGTSNFPGIFGLGAALAWRARHPEDLSLVRAGLADLELHLRGLPDLDVYPTAPAPWERRLGILAFRSRSVPASTLATLLSAQGLLVRSGLMCAARVAPQLGSPEGVVRLSPPAATTSAEFARGRALLNSALAALA